VLWDAHGNTRGDAPPLNTACEENTSARADAMFSGRASLDVCQNPRHTDHRRLTLRVKRLDRVGDDGEAFFAEFGEDRQGEDFGCGAFGLGEVAMGIAQVGEALLLVEA